MSRFAPGHRQKLRFVMAGSQSDICLTKRLTAMISDVKLESLTAMISDVLETLRLG